MTDTFRALLLVFLRLTIELERCTESQECKVKCSNPFIENGYPKYCLEMTVGAS